MRGERSIRAATYATALALLACTRVPASPPLSERASEPVAPPASTAVPIVREDVTAEPVSDAGPPEPDAERHSRLVVHLLPLQGISDEMVERTAEGLRSHAPVVIIIEPRSRLDRSIESSIKGRFRAEKILEWMDSRAAAAGKWMGVTDVDIVTKKGTNENWGILGLGALDGRCSVLSTFRMSRRWENGGASEAVVLDRLWKTAVHELGHTLGLPHCPTRGCIMEDAHGTVKTTDRETALCPVCARRFQEASGL